MSLPTIFKSEVGDILVALAKAGENRSQDYYDALEAVALALGFKMPPQAKMLNWKREREQP